jgi:hypothetical protein
MINEVNILKNNVIEEPLFVNLQALTEAVEVDIEGGKKDIVEVHTARELLERNISSIPKLLGDFFSKVGLMLFAGSSDTGKSMLTRMFSIWLSAGKSEFLGFRFADDANRKALMVVTEDDDEAISYLLRRQTKNLNSQEIENVAQNLLFLFDTEDIYDKIDSLLTDEPRGLVVIDTLGDLLNDVKDNGEARKTLHKLRKISMDHRCLIIVMHHTNKRTENQAPSKSNIMGAAGIEQKVRLALELRTDPNEENIKHLSVLKGNYLGKEYKNASFVLSFNEDDFTFENTGERVEFDNLIVGEPTAQSRKKALPLYSEIDQDLLISIIRPTLQARNEGYLISDLWPLFADNLQAALSLDTRPGRDKTKALINRMINDGVLKQMARSGKEAFIKFADCT